MLEKMLKEFESGIINLIDDERDKIYADVKSDFTNTYKHENEGKFNEV